MPAPNTNSSSKSPLLGYNTNVKHSDVVFHIQTEDSGIERPHVITHLFTEGTILATKKTAYGDHLEKADWEDIVRGMMKDQHKAMFIELRDGVHDEIAEKILGVPIGHDKGGDGDSDEQPADDVVTESGEDSGIVQVISPAAMSGKKTAESKGATPEQDSRSMSIFETPDAASSSFGESLISDKSLDEVILTYLKDDLDE